MDSGTLSRRDKARLFLDFVHRTAMHHAMWFAEVRHQLGAERAYRALEDAWSRSVAVQTKRLAGLLGFPLEDGLPGPLLDLEEGRLDGLLEKTAANWLANDGLWFQAVEFERGMGDAKRCNDSCWARFSPFEAWSIKRFLGLGPTPGLAGLRQALGLRLYAFLNRQAVEEEGSDALLFRMEDCRVQSARRRKGLPDYPCKSAGLVEYTTFAEAIDPRIRTECVGCPPDDHPEEWFCAWRFTVA